MSVPRTPATFQDCLKSCLLSDLKMAMVSNAMVDWASVQTWLGSAVLHAGMLSRALDADGGHGGGSDGAS